MDLDPVLVSRLQFAFTIIFHIIFPAFTIGLSAYIATLCVMWMHAGKAHYRAPAPFWIKLLAASFVVLAVGARFILAGTHLEHGRTMLRMAVGFAAVVAPLQLFIGDRHGLNTLEHQPLKIAAMEAHWDGSRSGELVLFAWPDESAEVNRFAITIPHGASLVLTHTWDGLFPGLTSVPPSDRPPV